MAAFGPVLGFLLGAYLLSFHMDSFSGAIISIGELNNFNYLYVPRQVLCICNEFQGKHNAARMFLPDKLSLSVLRLLPDLRSRSPRRWLLTLGLFIYFSLYHRSRRPSMGWNVVGRFSIMWITAYSGGDSILLVPKSSCAREGENQTCGKSSGCQRFRYS